MSMFNVFDIAGSAMTAQSVRLNAVASNLANADTVSGSEQSAYRAKTPLFQAVLENLASPATASVRVTSVAESTAPIVQRHDPSHPLADADGFVYLSNVKVMEQMADMISASRSYQNNVETLNTTKQMLLSTLRLGQ